jgi:uncharacterized protein (DUF3084 family)
MMKEQTNPKNPGESLLNKIKGQIEEIKSEMNQSEKQAKEALEKERAHFKDELEKAEKELDKLQQYGEKDADWLRNEIHQMEEELENHEIDNVRALDDYRYTVDREFRRFIDRAKDSFKNAGGQLKSSWSKMLDRLDSERKEFDNHIEMHKLQYEHEDVDTSRQLQNKKERINNELAKIESRIQDSMRRSSLQMQHKASEISQQFRNFKNNLAK